MRPPAFFLLALLAACSAPSSPDEGQAPVAAASGALKIDRSQAGLVAPNATFQTPEGASTTLAAFRGKPALVNFWATWCAPCLKELPSLNALAVRERGRLAVVAISQDSDGDDGTAAQKADAFFSKARLGALGAYVDAENALMVQLGLQGLPTTILYDAKGHEVWRVAGDADWTGAAAGKLLSSSRGD